MEQEQYIKTYKKGQHLNLERRVRLEYLLKNKKKLKLTNEMIAKELNISTGTIYREIKRGTVKGLKNSDLTLKDEYIADYAQAKYEKNITEKQGYLKIGKNIELSRFIEKTIMEEKTSPYVALGKAKKEGIDICEKTLYNYIHKEIFIELTANSFPIKRNIRNNTKEQKE